MTSWNRRLIRSLVVLSAACATVASAADIPKRTFYYDNNGNLHGTTVTCNGGACATLPAIPALTPTAVTVPPTSNGNFYWVTWQAAPSPGVLYSLEEATNSGFTTGLRTVSETTSLFAGINTRVSGLTYFYRVRGAKSGATSSWVNGTNGCVVTGPPAPPPSLSVPSSSVSGTFTVSWGASASPGVTYTLEEATDTSFTVGLRTVISGTTALLVSITGRDSEITYRYRVRAEKAGLSSPWVNGANGCMVPPAIFDFGGMYSYGSYVNPITGGMSCPSTYVAAQVLGTLNRDYPLYFCWRRHVAGTPGQWDLGGAMGFGYPSNYPNPATGTQTCPAGYTTTQVLGAKSDYVVNFCWRAHLEGSPGALKFGGGWGYVASAVTRNPATGTASCPVGYRAVPMLGTINKDYPWFLCTP